MERIKIRQRERPAINSRESFLNGLRDVVAHARFASMEYRHLGPSPYDNLTGVYITDLKKYNKELRKGVGGFLRDNRTVSRKFELTDEIKKIIEEARKFEGERDVKEDPNAQPGFNHHTGQPYY